MPDLWPIYRIGARPQALHFSYEKAGLAVTDQAIPWNAEAVLVEALLRLPAGRRKADLQLSLPDRSPVPAESLTRSEEHHRVTFRFSPPARTMTAEILYRGGPLGQLTLPVLGREEFIDQLRLHMPTLFVRLGDQHVACQTFVAAQCRGLMANAVLLSTTSLVPLLDLNLHVEFRSERSGAVCDVPVQLTSSQLAGRQALVTAVPHRVPKRLGVWITTWLLGDRPLSAQRIKAISLPHFQRSLRVCDTRFVVQTKEGAQLRRQVPALTGNERVGPCFLLASGEPGMAGLCTLRVSAEVAGGRQPPLRLEQEALITDGPTMFAPGTVPAGDLDQVNSFELRLKRTLLGSVSLSPSPAATFNAEGAFKTPDDYLWSAAAEEELTERLGKLLDGPKNNS
jgi:hypothetical protein